MSSTYNPIRYSLGDAYLSTEILVRLERTSIPIDATSFAALGNLFDKQLLDLPGLTSICPLFLDGRDMLPADGAGDSPFEEKVRKGLVDYLGQSLTLIRWVKGASVEGKVPLSATQVFNVLANYRLRFATPADATAALKLLKSAPGIAVAERAPYRYITVYEPRGEYVENVLERRTGNLSESLGQALRHADPPTASESGEPESLSLLGASVIAPLLTQIRDALLKAGTSIEKCDCCKPKSDVPDASFKDWPMTALETKFDENRGEGVRIAMLDLGVDWSHPGLRTIEPLGTPTKPRVFIGLSTWPISSNTNANNNAVIPVESVPPNSSTGLLNPHGPIGHHGTGVAGVMIGNKAGLLPKGEVVSFQVCNGAVVEYTDDQGKKVKRFTVDSVLYASALWSVGAHCSDVDALNISLGGSAPLCQFEQIGYHQIRAVGIMPFAGSGNHFRAGDDPTVNYPARHPEVISVGAVGIEMSTQFYKLAHFSNFDPDDFLVNLMAPGVGIYSCMPRWYGYKDDNHGWLNGTSLATPWVTALYALARKLNKPFIISKAGQKLQYQKADTPFDAEHGYGLVKFSKIFEAEADTPQ